MRLSSSIILHSHAEKYNWITFISILAAAGLQKLRGKCCVLRYESELTFCRKKKQVQVHCRRRRKVGAFKPALKIWLRSLARNFVSKLGKPIFIQLVAFVVVLAGTHVKRDFS